MKEQHLYTSHLSWGSVKFNLLGLREELIDYLAKNSTAIFQNHSPRVHCSLYGYNAKGVSVHVQEQLVPTESEPRNPRFIDVLLVSEITPTLSLEEKLKEIADRYQNNV